MNNARKTTKAELHALESVVAQGLTSGDAKAGAEEQQMAMDVVAGSGAVVFDDCYLPSIDDPYRGKVLVYMPHANPLLVEVYIWCEGAWEELPLHAAEV